MGLKEDLIAARALIDTPEKWRQSRGDDGPGTPCCAMVAVSRVAAGDTDRRHAMWLVLRDHAPGFKDHATIGRFNDAPKTTHADIMALFDRAINAAEASS